MRKVSREKRGEEPERGRKKRKKRGGKYNKGEEWEKRKRVGDLRVKK